MGFKPRLDRKTGAKYPVTKRFVMESIGSFAEIHNFYLIGVIINEM